MRITQTSGYPVFWLGAKLTVILKKAAWSFRWVVARYHLGPTKTQIC